MSKNTFIFFTVLAFLFLMVGADSAYRGLHNTDSSYNYSKLGVTRDQYEIGKYKTLDELHIIGMKQLERSYFLFGLAVVFGFIAGATK